MKYKELKRKIKHCKYWLDLTIPRNQLDALRQLQSNTNKLCNLHLDIIDYRKPNKINYNRDPMFKEYEKLREDVMKNFFTRTGRTK